MGCCDPRVASTVVQSFKLKVQVIRGLDSQSPPPVPAVTNLYKVAVLRTLVRHWPSVLLAFEHLILLVEDQGFRVWSGRSLDSQGLRTRNDDLPRPHVTATNLRVVTLSN
jgi:hypothetical protein